MQLQIKNINKTYKGNIQALKDLNLTIDQGMFGLLGPNGAGKTTLMKIIATLLSPTSGSILFDDTSITQNPQAIRQILGYLPQDIQFYPQLTVAETLDYLAILSNIQENRQEKIDHLIELVNLTDKKDQKVKKLSGGMKRRLGIAQALLNDPKLLIVDEPTAGLDPEERVRFRNLLSSLSSERIVLLSTHIVEDIAATSEKLAIINTGQLLFQGEVNQLIRNARGKVWQTTVSVKDYPTYQSRYNIVNAIRTEAGWNIKIIANTAHIPNATPIDPTIEDAYMFFIQTNKELA